MNSVKLICSTVAAALLASTIDVCVAAADEEARSAAEIAAELANPNTVLGSLTFNLDYIAFDGDIAGADRQEAIRLTFQPSLPYPLGPGFNLFVRPAIPIVLKQDLPDATGFKSHGVDLGDIGFDAALGKSFSNGWILIGGLVGTLPTATDDALGKDQWALGPEAAIAHVSRSAVFGVLLTHQWDVAGEDDYDTNLTGGQYFYTFNLKDGWQILASPTFAYDHEAEGGDDWTFPLGIGASKTTFLGGKAWKFGVQYWHYVEQADLFGPDWQIRFSVTPVVPLPWGGK